MKRTSKNGKKVSEGEARVNALDKYLRAKQKVIEGVDIDNARPAQVVATRRCPPAS